MTTLQASPGHAGPMDDLIEQWADAIPDDDGEWWPALPGTSSATPPR